jgi:hypothetical protein
MGYADPVKEKQYHKVYGIEWRADNPEKVRASARAYYHRNKEKCKTRHRVWVLKARYGITPEHYQEMLDAQRGVCLICGQLPKRGFHVDHNHRTKEPRGLLCSACNTAIGLLQESPKRLRAAAIYLEGWNA